MVMIACWISFHALVWERNLTNFERVFQKPQIHAELALGRTMVRKRYKKFTEWKSCGRIENVGDRTRSKMAGLVQAGRKATVLQIATLSNEVCRKTSLNVHHIERWSGWVTAAEDQGRLPLLSDESKKLMLEFDKDHKNSTIVWKSVAWSDESPFLLRYSDGIWRKRHVSID